MSDEVTRQNLERRREEQQAEMLRQISAGSQSGVAAILSSSCCGRCDKSCDQQANIIASHEAANEEMDDEKELMRGFLDEAEREFRRCKQEPAFANWALRFGLKIIQAARGELKWQVSTE